MKKLNHWMDHILYQIFKIVLSRSSKNIYKQNRKYNYIWNNSAYYLKLLMRETKELLGSTKSKITKVKNDENVHHLKISEVVLSHYKYGFPALSVKYLQW